MHEAYLKNLREALNNLYDPEHLRLNPLTALLGLNGRKDTPSALRRLLEDAIHALKPKESSQSQARRSYDLLLYRYEEQFSQKEVAEQLGVSVRQYQREQQVALKLLASYLEEKYNLFQVGETSPTVEFPPESLIPSVFSSSDLSWMFEPTSERICHFAQTLEAVLQLIAPLTRRYQVSLEVRTPDDLPVLSIHPEALRQVLVPVLSTAIHQTVSGVVRINVRPMEWDLRIEVRSSRNPSGSVAVVDSDQQGLTIARDILERSGGLLEIGMEKTSFASSNSAEAESPQGIGRLENGFSVRIFLPTLESLPILVIDDSPDNLQLLSRYLTNTRYCIVSLSEPEKALELSESMKPRVVVLDLMMPRVDGWEVLSLLQRNPETAAIPVIVCSILPQEELALELGASEFLRKPVIRERFLLALDHCVAGSVSAAH